MANLLEALMGLQWWEAVVILVLGYLLMGTVVALCAIQKDSRTGEFSTFIFFWFLSIIFEVEYRIKPYFRRRKKVLMGRKADRLRHKVFNLRAHTNTRIYRLESEAEKLESEVKK